MYATEYRVGISQNVRAFAAANAVGIGILVASWIVVFSPILFGGEVYFLDDLKTISYPLEHIYAQFQQGGQLPVWSNEFGFGHPLLAWGQLGFFTPLHLLLRAIGVHPLILLQISILTYFALGLLGMYTFLRCRRLSQLPATLGAVVFVFSGFSIGHVSHVNFTTATMLLPWLLVAVDIFLIQPTLPRTAVLALVAAAISLSGQPQISLYTLIIAALYGMVRLPLKIGHWRQTRAGKVLRTGILTGIAGILFFSLASFAILPLAEFLPSTDRAGDLPSEELYEFSYPPPHAITLVFPYFFGDYTTYWGAKNFQELAAYTGIIPLLLAGSALTSWRRHRGERIWAFVLIAGSVVFVFGQYSPVYRVLVESHVASSLTVPGRFVYLFDVGIAVLAALGLQQLSSSFSRNRLGGIVSILAGAVLVLVLIAPFWWYAVHSPDATQRLQELTQTINPSWVLLLGGAGVFVVARLLARLPKLAPAFQFLLLGITVATLIVDGWNYNPRIPWTIAREPSPFIDELTAYGQSTGVPARLYAAQSLPLAGQAQVLVKPTEPISPIFTIHQPFTVDEGISCVMLPLQADSSNPSGVVLELRSSLVESPLVVRSIAAQEIEQEPEQTICLPAFTESERRLVLTLRSEHDTSVRALFRAAAETEEHAYLVRVVNPTLEQLERSRKPVRIVLDQQIPAAVDIEQALLVRHMNATASVSSARWIGALGIAQYRAFVEEFFANDRDPFDGEGVHALARYKNLVDMAGITHFTQAIPRAVTDDAMIDAGYLLVESVPVGAKNARLYRNPDALPKAYLVPRAIWEPGPDQTRHALMDPSYDPRTLIYVSGERPPSQLGGEQQLSSPGTATIAVYEPTRVEIIVKTPHSAWLVLTDTFTPAWKVAVDGTPADPYVANTLFRAVYVPAGTHTVRWEYTSPAIAHAKALTGIGIAGSISLLVFPLLTGRRQK